MGLRRLYQLLMNSQRKPKQSPRAEQAEASLSDPRASATDSDYLVADTSQAETTPPQATDEIPPNQEPLPSDISKGKQPERVNMPLPEIRSNQRLWPDLPQSGRGGDRDAAARRCNADQKTYPLGQSVVPIATTFSYAKAVLWWSLTLFPTRLLPSVSRPLALVSTTDQAMCVRESSPELRSNES